MATSLSGVVRVCLPSSPAHCLLDVSSAASLRVRVQLYHLPPLLAEEDVAAAATRALSMECIIHQRVAPLHSQRAQFIQPTREGEAAASPLFAFCFEGVEAGRYHVLAFTELTEEDTDGGGSCGGEAAAARYIDPSRQAFGFYAERADGSALRWPWSVVEVAAGGERVLAPFPLRVPHSFEFVQERRVDSEAAGAWPVSKVAHGSMSLLRGSLVPVLHLSSASPYDRGVAHGHLCAPYILDFWRFYMLEQRFGGDVARYEQFVQRWAAVRVGFFHYSSAALDEARGVVDGMKRAAAQAAAATNGKDGLNLQLEELGRELGVDDILAGYIETRTVISTPAHTASAVPQQQQPQPQQLPQQESGAAKAGSEPVAAAVPGVPASDASLAHHCSQAVLWGGLTSSDGHGGSGGRVIAGRNMDGEIDLRKVTATHSLLIATERDPVSSDKDAPRSFRTISLMWPGLIGTLTGVNETGLYICENAGETQPGSGLVSGLAPVASVQQAALRTLDGRGLTPEAMKDYLAQFVSHTGWDAEEHAPISAEQRQQQQAAKHLAQYASDTQGGFSGPGSIFVVATPPYPGQASAAGSSVPPNGWVIEADRTHTAVRLAGHAPPLDGQLASSALLATNHALSLGFDDLGVLSLDAERRRAPIRAHQRCASLSPLYSGAAASGRLTNWNVPIGPKSYWRFEAGRNKLQAIERRRQRSGRQQQVPAAGAAAGAAKDSGGSNGSSSSSATSPSALGGSLAVQQLLGVEDVKDLLQTMCPAYTEHSFLVDLRSEVEEGSAAGAATAASGAPPRVRVRVHVAVADRMIGMWDAPYAPWHEFDFEELFDA